MSRWGVFKVYDSGRAELIGAAKSPELAQRLAGKLRDGMNDGQVGDALESGWNYLARQMSPADAARARVRSYIANNRTSYQSRTQHKIAKLTKRLSRQEVKAST